MSRSVSPGAALLRSSRMFSMPAPLSAPSDLAQATKHKSATATAPYPTHLTVTTPQSSRMVGDWGFKRPLPLKTTTKSTLPLVRVRQVDSIEHITDFQSATDHTITLKKFQEMNISMSVPQAQVRNKAMGTATTAKTIRSVFEEEDDVTAMSPEDRVTKENTRWKFNGPWLAGMTDGEFNKYLSNTVHGKRSEFHDYLKNELAAEMTKAQNRQAQEDAKDAPEPMRPEDISEEAFTKYLRNLRHDRVLLSQHVSRFLDLAPLTPESTILAQLGILIPNTEYTMVGSPYAATGPPITHPSAGISYLRTSNFMENHPLYGPQATHAPVKARIVMPKNSFTGGYQARIGVGGFITGTSEGETTFRNNYKNNKSIPGMEAFLPDVEGGSKFYVTPVSASVDASGKVALRVAEAEPVSVVVQKEMVGEGSAFMEAKKSKLGGRHTPRGSIYRPFKREGVIMGNKSSYGLN